VSEPSRIAVFFMTLDNDYQDLLKESCRVAARRHGFSVREVSARNDGDLQLRQIRECLAEPESIRPRAILVSPVKELLLRPACEEAARVGVAFVILNRPFADLDELHRKYPKVPLFSVVPDQRNIGRIQGQQFRWLLRKPGALLYITGTAGTASTELRLEGVKRELANVDVEMVIETGDWSMGSGARATEHWLEGRGVSDAANWVVGAQNDSMAMGARSALVSAATALKRPDLLDLPVTGCDGTPSYGQALIGTGQLSATVVIPPTTGRAVDELAQAFSSGRAPTLDISLEVSSFPDLADLGTASRTRAKSVRGHATDRPR
jgi:ABC-type sugar transport system substrate-binding protein